MNWFLINIVFPVGLPLLLLLLAKLANLESPYKERVSILKSVQDGQLYWVAMGFSATCMYDVSETKSLPAYLSDIPGACGGILLGSGVLVLLGILFPFEEPATLPIGFWKHVRVYRMLAGSVCALVMVSALWLTVHLTLTTTSECVKIPSKPEKSDDCVRKKASE